jgi:catechol 2,3-dioxygenase-like lactoylglutathione lyase family enzyme
MAENSAPAIAGIHHISFTVRDIDASISWYERVFHAQRLPMTFPHYGCEGTGYAVLLIEPRSGLAIGLHKNTGNGGDLFDEAQTGLDHIGFAVTSREELDAWASWLDTLDIPHSGIRTGDEPVAFATLVFRDPDNIQLELFAAAG